MIRNGCLPLSQRGFLLLFVLFGGILLFAISFRTPRNAAANALIVPQTCNVIYHISGSERFMPTSFRLAAPGPLGGTRRNYGISPESSGLQTSLFEYDLGADGLYGNNDPGWRESPPTQNQIIYETAPFGRGVAYFGNVISASSSRYQITIRDIAADGLFGTADDADYPAVFSIPNLLLMQRGLSGSSFGLTTNALAYLVTPPSASTISIIYQEFGRDGVPHPPGEGNNSFELVRTLPNIPVGAVRVAADGKVLWMQQETTGEKSAIVQGMGPNRRHDGGPGAGNDDEEYLGFFGGGGTSFESANFAPDGSGTVAIARYGGQAVNLHVYEMNPETILGGRSVGLTPPFPSNALSPEILNVAIDGNDSRHARQLAVMGRYADSVSNQDFYLFWNVKSGPDGILGTADDTNHTFTVRAYPTAGDWIYSFEFRNNVVAITGVMNNVSPAGGAYITLFCR